MSPDPEGYAAPGLVCRPVPHAAVTIQDPSGRHRIFRGRQTGERFAVNERDGTAWSVCVAVAGMHYVVPPNWVKDIPAERPTIPPGGAVIIPFLGRRREHAQ